MSLAVLCRSPRVPYSLVCTDVSSVQPLLVSRLPVKLPNRGYRCGPLSSWLLQWGTADAEIKVRAAENAELSKVLPLQHAVGQNRPIATHASPAASNFSLSNFYLFDPFSFTFSKSSP